MSNPFWKMSVPVWASRPDSDGRISSWSVQGWMFFLVSLLIQLNVLIWSVIGLVVAVLTIGGLF